jgi:ferritin heavy chain
MFFFFQSLLDLNAIATKHDDAQMTDFLESEYLQEQVDAQKELGDWITQLNRVGPGLGEWHFDRYLLNKEY